MAGNEWLYLPARVRVLDGGSVELDLLYAVKAEVPADLQRAQLEDPYGNRDTCFRKEVVGCFSTDEYETYANVVVNSAFEISHGATRARFYLYGFVPSPNLYIGPYTTKEHSFFGTYVRSYYNLCCMVTGQHVLQYDGVEQGVFRLNDQCSIGREVVDMYASFLTSGTAW